MLKTTNLSVGFLEKDKFIPAVDNITLEISPGKTLVFMGESGGGKSITAQAIMRLLPPNAYYSEQSQIYFNDNNLLNLSERFMQTLRGKKIGMIFQDPMTALNPVLTIKAQLKECLPKTTKTRLIELLTEVGIKDGKVKLNAYPHQLSGGQRQRIVIAMAIANRPDYLIADEPTTALDVVVQAQILELLQSLLKKYHMGLLLITHDLNVVKKIADTVAVIYAGKILESFPVQELFSADRHAYTAKLIEAVPSFGKRNDCWAKTQPTISRLDLGPTNILIEVDNISILYKNFKAVESLSFQLKYKQTLAIVGESGSGKSTVCRALLKLIPYQHGHVYYKGTELKTLHNAKLLEFRKQVQIIFQDSFSTMNPRMTIEEILEEGMRAHKMPKALMPKKIRKLLDEVGINSNSLNKYPHHFSGGQRQRLCIARALAVEPKILICDEPTSALDLSVQDQILKLLKNLQNECNLTYLMVSHNMGVVSYLADEVIVMRHGKKVEQASIEKILSAPENDYTKALLAGI